MHRFGEMGGGGGCVCMLFHLEKQLLDLCMCIIVVVSLTSTNLVDCISVCVAWHVDAYSISYKFKQLHVKEVCSCQNRFKSFSLSLNTQSLTLACIWLKSKLDFHFIIRENRFNFEKSYSFFKMAFWKIWFIYLCFIDLSLLVRSLYKTRTAKAKNPGKKCVLKCVLK